MRHVWLAQLTNVLRPQVVNRQSAFCRSTAVVCVEGAANFFGGDITAPGAILHEQNSGFFSLSGNFFFQQQQKHVGKRTVRKTCAAPMKLPVASMEVDLEVAVLPWKYLAVSGRLCMHQLPWKSRLPWKHAGFRGSEKCCFHGSNHLCFHGNRST